METHDLFDFLKESSDVIRAEYERITRRSAQDPGTAGDEGEGNWRTLLSNWLPPKYKVVTKGRIIFQNGTASPQIDVLVLSPEYPNGLTDAGKKLYLAGGVLAAFECKLTLRQEHLREAFETSRLIADAMPSRWGSPYRELHRPMVYGLLAHSHEWNGARAQPEENIDSGLSAMLQALDHPRKMLDVLCVSDVGTWTATKAFTTGRHEIDERGSITWRSTNDPLAFAGYVRHHQSRVMTTSSPFTNVGAMVMDLWTRLGRERAELRPIADYFHSVPGLAGDGRGVVKSWRLGELLSQSVQDELARLDSQSPRIPQPAVCTEKNSGFWSDWHQAFTW